MHGGLGMVKGSKELNWMQMILLSSGRWKERQFYTTLEIEACTRHKIGAWWLLNGIEMLVHLLNGGY